MLERITTLKDHTFEHFRRAYILRIKLPQDMKDQRSLLLKRVSYNRRPTKASPQPSKFNILN